jgi:hypothetical protein
MITMETLTAKRNNLAAMQQQAARNVAQAQADLNAIGGALNILDELIAEEKASAAASPEASAEPVIEEKASEHA